MKKLRLKYASSLLLASALFAPSASASAMTPFKVLLAVVTAYTASGNQFTANENNIQSSHNSGFDTYNEYYSPANGVASEQSILGYDHITRMSHNNGQYGPSRVEEAKRISEMYTGGHDIDRFLQNGVQPNELFSVEFEEMSLKRPKKEAIEFRRRLQLNTTTSLTPNATIDSTTSTLMANTTSNSTMSTTEEDDSSSDSFEEFLDELGGDNRDENIVIFTAVLVGICAVCVCADGVLVWGCKQDCAPDKCSKCCKESCNWDTCCKKFSCGKCADCKACCIVVPLCGAFCVSSCTSCCNCCPKFCKQGFGCENCCAEQSTQTQTLGENAQPQNTADQIELKTQEQIQNQTRTVRLFHDVGGSIHGVPPRQKNS